MEIEPRLTIAIQKNGRLSESSQQLLNGCGIQFDRYDGNGQLYTSSPNYPLDIYYDRDDDIPEAVEASEVSLGIVGQNIIRESGANIEELAPLGFGNCRLVVAAPLAIRSFQDLKGKRIATSYPRSSEEFFRSRDIPIIIKERSGSVETSIKRGSADAIVDLTATGRSLAANNLRVIDTIFSSEAILIGNRQLKENTGAQRIVEDLLFRIDSVLQAKNYRYVVMNTPMNRLNEIQELIPGLKAPTITPLLNQPDWASVGVVVLRDKIFEVAKALKESGAQGILVMEIQNMIS